ncbi:MAG: arginyltransferase [Alphaproteobacteria bacterium]|nr:arginyltransferase [Alphaproteobacteria bacterium]
MTSPSRPFFLSAPSPCPYRRERLERKFLTHLHGDPAANRAFNSDFCRLGFRRSHDILYRSACPDCAACTPVRVVAGAFRPTRSLRRVVRRNKDLVSSWDRVDIDALFDLFQEYERVRHQTSPMAEMNRAEFSDMMRRDYVDSRHFCLHDAVGTLLGCMLVDPVSDGFSAVYSFFSVREASRSLGTALVLALIEEARACSQPFVYLGYWIEGTPKMAYKAHFKPFEAFGAHGWGPYDETFRPSRLLFDDSP